MSKKNGNTAQEFHFPQPKEHVSFGKMLYNRDEGTYFGRTLESWFKIGLFYIIFYIVLAGLFAICLAGLFSSLDADKPKWQLEDSLIGTNPGLGFRPLSEDTLHGSIIQFDTKKIEEGEYWVEMLDEFLADYKENSISDKENNIDSKKNITVKKIYKNKMITCGHNQPHNTTDVCGFDVSSFGPCSSNNSYGYKVGSPCIFLKLNKIYNWMPLSYNDPTKLDADMPEDLKTHIKDTPEKERDQVWVSCEGQYSADKDNVKEPIKNIKYYPQRGFPAFYYPYLNQDRYLSPLVAVQFENMPTGALVNIVCKAWAKNIIYGNGGNRGRMGSVTFQFLID